MLIEHLAAAPVDVARGGADVGVGEPVERLAQKVHQAALALEQREEGERPVAVLLCRGDARAIVARLDLAACLRIAGLALAGPRLGGVRGGGGGGARRGG